MGVECHDEVIAPKGRLAMQTITQQKNHFIRTGYKLAAAAVVLSGSVTMRVQPAYGCSCMMPESATVESDRATAVFAGEVTAKTLTGEQHYGDYRVEFTISQLWKGDIGNTISITTANNSAACGFNFETGENYLVYTYGDITDMQVASCGRTSLLENTAEDVDELGNGTAPVTQPSGTTNDNVSEGVNINFVQRSLQGFIGLISNWLGK